MSIELGCDVYYTLAEVAEMSGFTINTVRRHIRKGYLHSTKLPTSSLREYIEQNYPGDTNRYTGVATVTRRDYDKWISSKSKQSYQHSEEFMQRYRDRHKG